MFSESTGNVKKGNRLMKKEQVLVVILVVFVLAGIFLFVRDNPTSTSDNSGVDKVTETVTAPVTAVETPGTGSGSIDWNDYTPGLAQAKNQGKNVFLYFYAQWCTYCTKLKQTTFLDEKVQAYLDENFISISVNTDQNQALSQSWQVTGLPTMWFLTPEGDRISSLPGYVDGAQLLKILKYIHTQSYVSMTFQDFVKQ
jgi:thioredoxin-related protein